MNNYLIISRENYNLVEFLNSILKESGLEQRIELRIIDTAEKIGVMVSIPSIFNPTVKPFELEIVEEFKTANLPVTKLLESINYDLADLLKTIRPDIIKLSRINSAFDYTESIIRSTNVEQIDISINETYNRHDSKNNRA